MDLPVNETGTVDEKATVEVINGDNDIPKSEDSKDKEEKKGSN